MPETSLNTRVEDVNQHCQKVRSLLRMNPQQLTTIKTHLGLIKPQTLTVMQRLETDRKIFCRAGVWRLTTDK